MNKLKCAYLGQQYWILKKRIPYWKKKIEFLINLIIFLQQIIKNEYIVSTICVQFSTGKNNLKMNPSVL